MTVKHDRSRCETDTGTVSRYERVSVEVPELDLLLAAGGEHVHTGWGRAEAPSEDIVDPVLLSRRASKPGHVEGVVPGHEHEEGHHHQSSRARIVIRRAAVRGANPASSTHITDDASCFKMVSISSLANLILTTRVRALTRTRRLADRATLDHSLVCDMSSRPRGVEQGRVLTSMLDPSPLSGPASRRQRLTGP